VSEPIHPAVSFHAAWTLALNEASYSLSEQLVEERDRNGIVREYIWGGLSRSLRHLIPAPMWDPEADLRERSEEAELWREKTVVGKAKLHCRTLLRSSIPLTSSRA
jgi:hypothetical protein